MIGVCIKYFHENYGGMLQAYATTAILEQRGLEYELIRYEKVLTVAGVIRSLPRLFNGVLLNDKYEMAIKRYGLWRHPEIAEKDRLRMKAFQRFKEEHFSRVSPVFKGYEALCEGARRYSAVITGSDQLWSPAGLPTNYYNLKFVPNDIRKISYASSFGVKDVPWYQRKRTADFLNRIEFVSMRENRGAQIVEELTGRSVPTILDPVLMFDETDWEKLIPVEREIEGPYLLAYFLGNNPEHRSAVTEAARKLKCKIVTFRHMDQYVLADEDFGDIALYDVSPARFLNLLRNARYVCTDSFHGFCFSVLHRKNVVVFNRYSDEARHSKNSRIDTLCTILNLQDRRYEDSAKLITKLRDKIDYESVLHILEGKRRGADRYLEEALSGVQ